MTTRVKAQSIRIPPNLVNDVIAKLEARHIDVTIINVENWIFNAVLAYEPREDTKEEESA